MSPSRGPARGTMHLGIDFDNTVVTYDRVFLRHALELGLVTAQVKGHKRDIRDRIRLLEEGEKKWTELQGLVYGRLMGEAEPAEGVEEFLAACRARSVRVSIISHKTEFPAAGERVNLRRAAGRWLTDNGFPSRFGISPEEVIFTGSMEEKLAAIGRSGCTHFIDDLVEILLHPGFPPGVERILYAPGGEKAGGEEVRSFRSWREIGEHLFGEAL